MDVTAIRYEPCRPNVKRSSKAKLKTAQDALPQNPAATASFLGLLSGDKLPRPRSRGCWSMEISQEVPDDTQLALLAWFRIRFWLQFQPKNSETKLGGFDRFPRVRQTPIELSCVKNGFLPKPASDITAVFTCPFFSSSSTQADFKKPLNLSDTARGKRRMLLCVNDLTAAAFYA